MHGVLNASRATVALFAALALMATTGCRSEYKRHCDLGRQLRNEERYEEAIQEYELAAKASPLEVRPYENIAKIYKHQGKYDTAAKYYRKILEVAPDYIDAYAQLVKMMRLAGQIDEASKTASAALQKTEVKRDMKASRQIQEQMIEIENARKARQAPLAAPPTVGAPLTASTTATTLRPANVQPPPAKP